MASTSLAAPAAIVPANMVTRTEPIEAPTNELVESPEPSILYVDLQLPSLYDLTTDSRSLTEQPMTPLYVDLPTLASNLPKVVPSPSSSRERSSDNRLINFFTPEYSPLD